MLRSSNHKLKPLYLSHILLERTDKNNVLTAQELMQLLEEAHLKYTTHYIESMGNWKDMKPNMFTIDFGLSQTFIPVHDNQFSITNIEVGL